MAYRLLREDWDTFRSGNFWIVNNVWNKGDLVNGVDYTQTIQLDTAHINRNISFNWSWPVVGDVLAYPEIGAGFSPWSESGTARLSARIDHVSKFSISYHLAISGDRSLYNVAFDLWLTDAPRGNADTITTEVMIWLHDGKFTPPGDVMGHYSHKGLSGTVYSMIFEGSGNNEGWRYIAIEADRELRRGTIDVAHVLEWLEDRGLVSGDDYVNGYELGAEVAGGDGGMVIHSIQHRFARSMPLAAELPDLDLQHQPASDWLI